jgi:hypothetical protein
MRARAEAPHRAQSPVSPADAGVAVFSVFCLLLIQRDHTSVLQLRVSVLVGDPERLAVVAGSGVIRVAVADVIDILITRRRGLTGR